MKQALLVPFLKWPGGKRWLTANHSHLLPPTFKTYIEPFLGGGSVFFFLQPHQAILGDSNKELVNAYLGVKNNWKPLVRLLREHQNKHSACYYYQVRESKPKTLIAQAARTIYLNRNCFNGIYRVNQKGEFNVPIGEKRSILYETDDFQSLANALSKAEIKAEDFESLIDSASAEDFVFADPPYTVRHNNNGFIKYNEQLFSWNDQIRLAHSLSRAQKRGVHVVSTNAYHEHIRDLYRNLGFRFETASRYSSISANASSRRAFSELIILSD